MSLREHGIDPATVTAIRGGNAIWPGLSLFTGVSFLIHAAVRVASGDPVTNPGLLLEAGASLVMTIFGGIAMARRRYFVVTVETTTGRKRIGGLTRPAQMALLEEVERPEAPKA